MVNVKRWVVFFFFFLFGFCLVVFPPRIFGCGGGEKLASQYQTEVIGRLPLDIDIRERADAGAPIIGSSEGSSAEAYLQLATNMDERISHDLVHNVKEPKISITDD